MSISLHTNIAAQTARRGLRRAEGEQGRAIGDLSTGVRIRRAGDDAAGLAISEKLKSQITGMHQATRNAQDGISLLQTAETALGEELNALQRIRTLAVQAASDGLGVSDREAIQKEVAQLQTEISRIAQTTSFGDGPIFGERGHATRLQVGAQAGQELAIFGYDASAQSIGSQTFVANGNMSHVVGPATTLPATQHIDFQVLSLHGSPQTASFTISAGTSAKEVTSNVNARTELTGITAEARTALRIGPLNLAGTIGFTLYGDSNAPVVAEVADPSNLEALRNAINARTEVTGITAELDSPPSSLLLRHPDGEDIGIEAFSSTAGGATLTAEGIGFDDQTNNTIVLSPGAASSALVAGHMAFHSEVPFQVDSTRPISGIAHPQDTLLPSDLVPVSSIDLTTRRGAHAAIRISDAALQKLAEKRSELGAVQNRLGATMDALASAYENLQTARSRIRDADVAERSAGLARSQVLREASTSVLAQANQNQNLALKLLGDS